MHKDYKVNDDEEIKNKPCFKSYAIPKKVIEQDKIIKEINN